MGFIAAVVGVVAWLVHPEDIHATRLLNRRPLESSLATPSYMLFCHRGQLLVQPNGLQPEQPKKRDATPAPAL